MSTHDPKHDASPGYASGQLARALEALSTHADPAVRARATKRLSQWQRVLTGMADGTLSVGTRLPVSGVPAWATLEVAHGGFATGALKAEGALLPYETGRAMQLGVEPTHAREALNRYSLTDDGQRALGALLDSGCYRIDVPEEGALLAVTWLLGKGDAVRAMDVLDAIDGFFPRLRFYPAPAERPVSTRPVVHLRSVGDVLGDLQAVKARPQIDRMHEALTHWTPLYDQAVALFLETVVGEVPSLATDAAGALVRRADGCPVVQGAYPCQRYPEGWAARAQRLLDAYASLRETHTRSGKPDNPKENFARLRGYLARCVADPKSLTGRDVGTLRKVLASFVTAHGAPDSARRGATREAQRRIAALPSLKAQSEVLCARLRPYPRDEGLGSLDLVCAPRTAREAAGLGVAEGSAWPEALLGRVERCLEASVDVLVSRGIVSSGDVLAELLPQVTAQVAVADFDDARLRRLYGALYSAFRRRRSLLLLHLEKQVKLSELPWVSALDAHRRKGDHARRVAHDSLAALGALTLGSFPESIVPNKLLNEMVALAGQAGLSLPFTEELAADIFMDAFATKFVQAAKMAAVRLRGTVYARYYDLPCDKLLALGDVKTKWGVATSPGFLALCKAGASAASEAGVKAPRYGSPARNGAILEQAQILTTHNLVVLYEGLQLKGLLEDREAELARQCFVWVCKRLQVTAPSWHAKLIALKNCAYAWRQMLFFLSVANAAEQAAFAQWAEAHFAAQDEVFRDAFGPAFEGLRRVLRGETLEATGRAGEGVPARRFLGWSVGKHWLS